MERDNHKILIISIVVASILVISLIIVTISKISKSTDEEKFVNELSSYNESSDGAESTSSSIGKTVEESENELANKNSLFDEDGFETAILANSNSTNTTNTTNDTKNESSSSGKNNDVNKTNNTSKTENTNTSNTTEASKSDKKEKDKIEFQAPVKGEIIREFANDSLVYSNTLQEWITHNGVDIKADKTSVVKAAAAGKVTSIKNDPRYGLTIIIEHNDGYKTIYSNLLTTEFVVEGEDVEQGQTLGTVGNSSSFEVSDDYHLHFELLKDGEYLDPTIYMEF